MKNSNLFNGKTINSNSFSQKENGWEQLLEKIEKMEARERKKRLKNYINDITNYIIFIPNKILLIIKNYFGEKIKIKR